MFHSYFLTKYSHEISYNCIMFFIMMFVEQWLVLTFLILLFSKILKRESSVKRMFLAAAIGSSLGCMGIQWFWRWHLLRFLFLIVSVWVTVRVAFLVKKKKCLYFTGYILAGAGMLGGIWTACSGFISLPWMVVFVISAGACWIFFRIFWENFRQQKDFLYEVAFEWNQKTIKVCAFLDTGNFLYEPIGHMPVSVLEEEAFLRYFDEPLTELIKHGDVGNIRMIPYRSVGCEEGMMPGILVKNIQITNGNQKAEAKKGMVGISKGALSSGGNYELLLHPDLIKCGRL